MGMGWPQQLDVRLDGKLLKRFTVGGDAPGTPGGGQLRRRRRAGLRRRSRVGNVHAADRRRGPRGARAGRRPARASSASRSCASCGSRKACRNRCSAARVLTNDQIYMGYAAVGSVQIGGPYRVARAATDTPSRRAIFVCQPTRRTARPAAGRRLRHEDPVADGAAGLSPAGDRRRRADAARVLRQRPAGGRQLRRGHSVRARADAGRSGFPAARPAAIPPASESRGPPPIA